MRRISSRWRVNEITPALTVLGYMYGQLAPSAAVGMKCLVGLAPSSPAAVSAAVRPSPSLFKKMKNRGLRALLVDEQDDPLFEAAFARACLRFQETHRPEPLIVDPYAGCFVPPDIQMDVKNHKRHHYCLATKFIDDKLISTTHNMDGLKQVVLFADGLDTRPYRLNWPNSTVIFEISPDRVFKRAAQKLEDVGAKIPRSCLYLHVPLESSDLQQMLHNKGFIGDRPSIWAFQGLPVVNLASFHEKLLMVGNLAMKGCFFLGELPAWLAETELGMKSTTNEWMQKFFLSNGFKVNVLGYHELAKNFGKEPEPEEYNHLLFVAEHLRFSDQQMENWRREFQRIEGEGDEEGFEEL